MTVSVLKRSTKKTKLSWTKHLLCSAKKHGVRGSFSNKKKKNLLFKRLSAQYKSAL